MGIIDRKIEQFVININSDYDVFEPGQFIDGKCIIETNGEITCKYFKIKVKGIAKVHWTTYHNPSRANQTRYHGDEVRYFNNSVVFCI